MLRAATNGYGSPLVIDQSCVVKIDEDKNDLATAHLVHHIIGADVAV